MSVGRVFGTKARDPKLSDDSFPHQTPLNTPRMAEPDTKAMLDIGKYCPTCRTVDFLPRRCEFCKLVFCASHASPPSLHDCSGLVDSVVVEGRFDQKFQDLLPGSREGLIAAERAEAELVKDQRREAAQAILRKNFGDAAVGRGGPKEVKAAVVKARSAVVELAILKGKAKQGDPRKGLGEVKMEDRIYFKAVFYEFKSGERAEAGMKELWMPKVS